MVETVSEKQLHESKSIGLKILNILLCATIPKYSYLLVNNILSLTESIERKCHILGKSSFFFQVSSHFLTVMLSKYPSSLSVKAKMPTNIQQQPHQPPEIDDIQYINIESVELECNIVRGQSI